MCVSPSRRQSLLEELTEFGLSYDLHGSGYRYREEQAKRRIAVFQEELMLLEAGELVPSYRDSTRVMLVTQQQLPQCAAQV